MSDISELQMLLMEKKAIETKIRALKAPVYIRNGSVKIEKKKQDFGAWQVCAMTEYDKTEYETRESYDARIGREDAYGYYTNRKQIATFKASRWWPFIREDTKEEALKTIKMVANDLLGLVEKIEKETADDVDVSDLALLDLDEEE